MTISEALGILELEQGYTKEQLKKQYRRLASKNHPDVAGEEATEKYIKIVRAFELLSSSGLKTKDIVLTHASIFRVVKI